MGLIMNDADYRALDRLNFSSVKHLLDSPLKYLHQKDKPFMGSEATELGTAVHLWLQGEKNKVFLEPDLSYIKTKQGFTAKNPKMTDEGKKIIEEFRASLPKGSITVSQEQVQILKGIEANFYKNKDIVSLMSRVSGVEKAHIAEIDGEPFKGKTDWDGDDFIIDFKTTSKGGNLQSFKRTIYESHYDLQAAIYMHLKPEARNYYMIVGETVEPYEVFIYELSQNVLDMGREKLATIISRYKRIIKQPEVLKNFYNEMEVL